MTQRARKLFYVTPVVVWLMVIFLASTQFGAEQVTLHALIRLLKLLTPEQAGNLNADAIGKTNFLIRKCAHITEYAILALLTARAVQFGQERLKWQAFVGGLAMSAGYACLDEFHQSFVPGRTANFHDVLIDTVGATLALTLMVLWFRIKAYERSLTPLLATQERPEEGYVHKWTPGEVPRKEKNI